METLQIHKHRHSHTRICAWHTVSRPFHLFNVKRETHQWTRMQQKTEIKLTSVKVRQFSLCILIPSNKTLGEHLLQTYIEFYVQCNAPMHFMWCKSIECTHQAIHLFDSGFSLHLSLSIVASLQMFYFWYTQMLCALLDFNAFSGKRALWCLAEKKINKIGSGLILTCAVYSSELCAFPAQMFFSLCIFRELEIAVWNNKMHNKVRTAVKFHRNDAISR